MSNSTQRTDVFISYSHRDDRWRDDLEKHLKPYVRDGSITAWSDKQIQPGSKWLAEIQRALSRTKVAVLLVTPDFIASDFINEHEVTPLLKAAEKEGVHILWIPVYASSYMETSLKDYQTLCDPAKPLAEMKAERQKVWVKICQEIKSVANPAGPSDSSGATSVGPPSATRTWLAVLKNWLVTDFVEADPHIFQGHFAARDNLAETSRWQSKGGELAGDPVLPKRPYYQTYWGYRAAFKIAPEYIAKWRPITIDAIRRHFGSDRWLRVIREYSFTKGPTAGPRFAESVRHTVRAADLLHMLQPENRQACATAWDLISESRDLQRPDGGWVEFHGADVASSLWSTVYVFRFLWSLVCSPLPGIPDERDAFVDKAHSVLQETERFLITHWRENRWTFDEKMPWQEGAAAVLPEVAAYLNDKTVLKECCNALRSLVSPSGQLVSDGINRAPGAPPEVVQALRLAFALKTACAVLPESDSRCDRLSQWVSGRLDMRHASAHDIAFAVDVVDLNSLAPV